jgi:hypothetical protein
MTGMRFPTALNAHGRGQLYTNVRTLDWRGKRSRLGAE